MSESDEARGEAVLRLRLADQHAIEGSRCRAGNSLNFATAASSKTTGTMRCFSRCSGDKLRGRLWQLKFADAVL